MSYLSEFSSSVGQICNNLLLEFKDSICKMNELKYSNSHSGKTVALPIELLARAEEYAKFHSLVINGYLTFKQANEATVKLIESTINFHQIKAWFMMFTDNKRYLNSNDFDSQPYCTMKSTHENKISFPNFVSTEYAFASIKSDYEKAKMVLPKIEAVPINNSDEIIQWRCVQLN